MLISEFDTCRSLLIYMVVSKAELYEQSLRTCLIQRRVVHRASHERHQCEDGSRYYDRTLLCSREDRVVVSLRSVILRLRLCILYLDPSLRNTIGRLFLLVYCCSDMCGDLVPYTMMPIDLLREWLCPGFYDHNHYRELTEKTTNYSTIRSALGIEPNMN